MNFACQPSGNERVCAAQREQFSDYLDGTLSGVAMAAIAQHLDACSACADEFAEWRIMQSALALVGRARAPLGLQAQLRAALAEERQRGTHLAWHARFNAAWQSWARPMAYRAAMGTVAAVLMVGGVSALLFGTPFAVEANDEPLGAMTSAHYLYSEVPPQPIELGREVPILVEAKLDEQGRVYDYTIVSGPTDPAVERRVQANLLASVFQPATVFGVPVQSRVMMTYTGISVHG